MPSIVPIIEGDGEVSAVPLLLRRILYENYSCFNIQVGQPVNARGRSKLLTEFEKYLRHAQGKPGCGAILVLLDADDYCPINLALSLVDRCIQAHVDKPLAIVCANREYECWILASLDTVKGKSGVSESASFIGNPEDFRGVKGWLTSQMPQGRAYKETLDQAALTNWIDLNRAHENSRSFRRLCHAVEELLIAMDEGNIVITPSQMTPNS